MLEIQNVTKVYHDRTRCVTAVNVDYMKVAPGEQVALAGPSGSGKTTLFHLISGLLTPTKGNIAFDGVDIPAMPEKWRDAWRANTVGYVFQRFNLLTSLDVLDNVLVAMHFAGVIPHKQQRNRAIELLQFVGLGDRLWHKTHQLSMGEQQRVAIARAVANNPRLILADEPTASLDHGNSILVLELLRRLCEEQGGILLVATHDQEIMQTFARVEELRRPERQVLFNAACSSLA